MSKLVKVRQFNYNCDGKTYVVNVKRGKGKYYRLSVGKLLKEHNTCEVNFTSKSKISDNEIIAIINKHLDWLNKQFNKKEAMICLKDNEAMLHGEVVSHEVFNSCFENEIDYIKRRYLELAKIARVKGISLKFRKMKSRWGSYNKTKKIITLNKWLVILPYELIDYVICHELTHHYVFNHSKEFYNQLSTLYPDYLNARKAIKKYSDII